MKGLHNRINHPALTPHLSFQVFILHPRPNLPQRLLNLVLQCSLANTLLAVDIDLPREFEIDLRKI
jgi:hypothetical protein